MPGRQNPGKNRTLEDPHKPANAGTRNTMQTVTLTTCDNAAEAHLLQGALANAGIESVLTNEYTASTLRWGAAADSRHFLRSFRYWPGRRSAISRLPTAAAVAGRISANRLHLPDKLPETASQALPRTRIRRRNNESVPPRRPPRPRDPLPAPPRKPACTAEPILFPARLAGNEKRRIFIVPFMKNGYPKPQET